MYVISVKRIRDWKGNLYKPAEQEWEYGGYNGSPQSGYPAFGPLSAAKIFPSKEAAVRWWRSVRKEMNLQCFDHHSLAVRKITFEIEERL